MVDGNTTLGSRGPAKGEGIEGTGVKKNNYPNRGGS